MADLAVRIVELKARKRWPGLNDRTYEIVTRKSDEASAGADEEKPEASPDKARPPSRADLEAEPPGEGEGRRPGDDGWVVPK